MFSRIICRVLLFLLLISPDGRPAIAVEAENPDGSFQLRPGVVFDARRSLVMLMLPDGGIEAVDLTSGKTAWISRDGDKPLLVAGDLLLAQADTSEPRLLLVEMELNADGAAKATIAVDLPGDLTGSIDNGPGRKLEVQTVQTSRGAVVKWTVLRRDVAAVERLQSPRVDVRSATLRVDLADASYRAIENDRVAGLFVEPPPDLPEAERLPRIPGVQFRSARGNHILSSERVADNRVWDRYEWKIWDRKTGALVGSFRDFQRLAPFAVVGHVLLQEVSPYTRRLEGKEVVSPLSMRAVDLGDGHEIWRRAIRDTAYRGPLPE
jgi:hypothetical protein